MLQKLKDLKLAYKVGLLPTTAGIGFAVIEKDDRRGDNRSAGFLINTGFGVDYDLSRRTSVGSRMIFNFLPEKTLEERFFYTWEIVGLRIAF